MTTSSDYGLITYLTRRKTPVRALLDRYVAEVLPTFQGKVIELGALNGGRREHASSADEYLLSNILDGADIWLDATAMDLEDQSVDGFVCESMLEHVPEPHRVISEVRRVLRPGGKLLLITPWMYPFHEAPGDYLRFSEPALVRMLEGFNVLRVDPLGNFWTSLATFAQLKVHPWSTMSLRERALRAVTGSPLLGLGWASHVVSGVLQASDEFAAMYAVVAEKPM